MRTILFIVQKEFLQILRNRTMLPVIFLLPLIQLVILVNAATMDMKNINLIIVDKDLSAQSRKLADMFTQSPFFTVLKHEFSYKEAESEMQVNATDMILVIPDNFEEQIYHLGKTDLQIQIDAINGLTAGLINSYSSQIINSYYRQLISESGGNALINARPKVINMDYRFWYNTQLNFKYYMVPGILAILLTVIGMFLASLNLVREKEIGTIEQINVTPIRKYQFIIGKLLPFWIIALFDLGIGLLIGKLLFNIPIEGSLVTAFWFCITLSGCGSWYRTDHLHIITHAATGAISEFFHSCNIYHDERYFYTC